MTQGRDQAEPAQIDQHRRLEQLLGRHRHRPATRIAAREQRGDAVRQRPDVQAHHQRRRTLVGGRAGAQRLGGAAQHREGALGGLAQPGIAVDRDADLEHRRVIGRLGAGESEIGAAEPLEGGERLRLAAIPGALQMRLEQFEPAPRDIGDQRLAVAEMAVGRCRADPGRARCVGKGEPGRPFLRDKAERGVDQRLAQIAVVIAAPRARVLSAPSHVRAFYMRRPASPNAKPNGPEVRQCLSLNVAYRPHSGRSLRSTATAGRGPFRSLPRASCKVSVE